MAPAVALGRGQGQGGDPGQASLGVTAEDGERRTGLGERLVARGRGVELRIDGRALGGVEDRPEAGDAQGDRRDHEGDLRRRQRAPAAESVHR
jgi:hypothetical protein